MTMKILGMHIAQGQEHLSLDIEAWANREVVRGEIQLRDIVIVRGKPVPLARIRKLCLAFNMTRGDEILGFFPSFLDARRICILAADIEGLSVWQLGWSSWSASRATIPTIAHVDNTDQVCKRHDPGLEEQMRLIASRRLGGASDDAAVVIATHTTSNMEPLELPKGLDENLPYGRGPRRGEDRDSDVNFHYCVFDRLALARPYFDQAVRRGVGTVWLFGTGRSW